MSDMICRKSMVRCQTPGMCSPHGGCQDPVNAQLRAVNFDYEIGKRAADEEIARLKAEIARSTEREIHQLAEIEGLRKDAERYRWLRHGHGGFVEVVEWIGPHATGMIGEDLDALVDALMSKEPSQ